MTSSARSSLIAIARVRNVDVLVGRVLLDDPVDGLGLDSRLLRVVDAARQVAVGVGDGVRGEPGEERHQGDLREWRRGVPRVGAVRWPPPSKCPVGAGGCQTTGSLRRALRFIDRGSQGVGAWAHVRDQVVEPAVVGAAVGVERPVQDGVMRNREPRHRIPRRLVLRHDPLRLHGHEDPARVSRTFRVSSSRSSRRPGIPAITARTRSSGGTGSMRAAGGGPTAACRPRGTS